MSSLSTADREPDGAGELAPPERFRCVGARAGRASAAIGQPRHRKMLDHVKSTCDRRAPFLTASEWIAAVETALVPLTSRGPAHQPKIARTAAPARLNPIVSPAPQRTRLPSSVPTLDAENCGATGTRCMPVGLDSPTAVVSPVILFQ